METAVSERLAREDLRGAATVALRAYGPQLLGYLRATLPDGAADDAFSLFCELFWKGLPGFRGESSILTWSYQLAWSAARRVLEDPQRWRARRLDTDEMNGIVQEVRSSTAPHLRQSSADQLAKIRSQLDFTEQTLLVLRIDRELEWDEIATVMSIDSATLRKRFQRLKAKIRELAGA
ncbi:MAG TPA: sigma-70 family RNA polymerase sigma factor [Kofleriaceae bacterium]|nr:sigma-70 family RNA polymerase sigma factor [Kofleriaceae bacterium]